jgi:L-lactate dehydrogenase complex protein LldE
MLEEKLREIKETGAETLVSCDMSCLMHIGGALSRRGEPIRVMHLAELLASGSL